jgi:hypothetical protein
MLMDLYSSDKKLTNAYTDAPALQPNLLLGSLHLFFWFFFHPSAWCNYVMRLDPRLNPGFTLAELTPPQWRHPALRRLLWQGYLIWPLLVSLLTGLTLWVLGVPLAQTVTPVIYVLALSLTLGLMLGWVVSVAAGVVGGVLIGLAAGVASSLTTAWLESIAVPTAISLAMGVVGYVAASLSSSRSAYLSTRPLPRLGSQIGGIVSGVLIGVVAMSVVGFVLQTLTGLATGLTENTTYWLSRTLVVGVSFGLALGWQRGLKSGLLSALLAGLVYGSAVTGLETKFFNHTGPLVSSGLAVGLASGLLFGTSFGVTATLPYVLAERLGGPWAGAWAGALGSWGRHVYRNALPLWPNFPLGLLGILVGLTLTWWRSYLLYPLLAAWNLSLYRLDQQRVGRNPSNGGSHAAVGPGVGTRPASFRIDPKNSDGSPATTPPVGEPASLQKVNRPSLLRWHSAFWDEEQHLPLLGLDEHVLLILECDPDEGQAALAYLRSSRQQWAAQAAQLELEARRLEEIDSITALAQAHQRLVTGELSGPASALWRNLGHLSQDIASALNQTTAYHQRLALSTSQARLNNLERELTLSSEPYAARFYPIVSRWRQLVDSQLDQLAQAVEQSGEIDNPYVVGVPLTEHQEIFVGRTDIVARIEQLLLDRRRPPLLLYGQRRMGKTSLLRNLGRLLPRTVVPLFVDGQRCALANDYPDFLHNLAQELTKSAEQQRRLILPPLDRQSLAVSPFTGFNEWLDQVEQIFAAQGYRMALLTLDEFEMLDSVLNKGRFDETDVLSLLRHIIQHRPQFKVMLAGSHPLAEFQRWASYLINVQVVKVGYLEQHETQHLVTQPIKDFGLHYQPEASQRVWDLTRGHPALVQLLCYEIVTLKNEAAAAGAGEAGRLVCPSDVEAAVSRALASGNLFFIDIQQNQITPAGLTLLRFLALQGEGAIIGREALAATAAPPAELEPTLALLLQRDLIEAVAGGYRFQVELIRRWFAL